MERRLELAYSNEESCGLIDEDKIAVLKREITELDKQLASLEANRIH